MSITQWQLGSQIKHADVQWLVVRIVEKDTSLYEDKLGNQFLRTESYVMLKSAEGSIEFITLLEEKTPFERNPQIVIKPLEEIQWTTRKP